MAKTRPLYRPEFRRQLVELVRAGRSPDELAREFEPTAQSIRNWVAQAKRDAGGGDGGLTTAEREEGAPGVPSPVTRRRHGTAFLAYCPKGTISLGPVGPQDRLR